MSELHVGQTVMVSDVNLRGHRRARVSKIGRKYVYLENDKTPFAYSDWRGGLWMAADDYGHTSFTTLELFDLWTKADEARIELRQFGITLESSIQPAVVIEVRAALSTIVPRITPPSGTGQETKK